jgi:hypothetical protein
VRYGVVTTTFTGRADIFTLFSARGEMGRREILQRRKGSGMEKIRKTVTEAAKPMLMEIEQVLHFRLYSAKNTQITFQHKSSSIYRCVYNPYIIETLST